MPQGEHRREDSPATRFSASGASGNGPVRDANLAGSAGRRAGKRGPTGEAARASDAVRREADRFQTMIDAAVGEYRRRAAEEALRHLADVLTSTADALGQLASSLDVDASSIRTYREELRSEVALPLLRGLGDVRPGEALRSAHGRLLDEMSSVVSGVDELVARPEPHGLYEPSPSDGWIRRIRKGRVRAVRRAKHLTGRLKERLRQESTGSGQDQPLQRVPLRRLVSHHARVRLPLELQREHEAVSRAVGATIAMVARAATEHVHVVLRADRGLPTDVESESSGDAEMFRDGRAFGDGTAKPEGGAGGLRGHALLFENVLRAAAQELIAYDGLDRMSERSAAARTLLDRDLYESDSFMYDPPRRDADTAAAVRRRADERDALWAVWHARVRARLTLVDHLLAFREETVALESGLTARVREHGVDPVQRALDAAERALDRLSELAKLDFAEQVTAGAVRRHLQEALEQVEQETIAVLVDAKPAQTTRQACDDAAERLAAAIQDLPEQLELNTLEGGDDVDPERAPRRVDLREHAARAYDALLVEKLREAADRVARAVSGARAEAESVPGILRFNLGTALEDLEVDADEESPDTVRELVVDGLARSADVIGAASAAVSESFEPFEDQVREVFEAGYASLHERVQVEVRVREQMIDLRSDAQAGLRQAVARATKEARRSTLVARRAYRSGLRRAGEWVRLGREAAGLAAPTDEVRFATLDVLVDTDRVLEGLPHVYRRLFAFEPLRDPSLLQGREAEMRAVSTHVDRWNRGLTNALVLTGSHGSGHTSFVNVLRQTVLEDGSVRTLDLEHRLRSEEELVEALAATFDGSDAALATLDDLAEHINSLDEGLHVCIIEHLEHLYLRQIGGTSLAEAFLRFVSRTDSRVLWILTVSDYGWQVLRKAESAAAGLVVAQRLSPMTRDGLEAIVIARHRRSGLPLRFLPPPAETNPLLMRRLRKAAADEERQEILRADYFDRLQRACGQNVMLALLYWLRSTEMDEEAGHLLVRPIEPLNFGFLQSLELDQAFALKAMLEHASLSVEEHSEIFLVPPARSIETFETLGNLLLIEPRSSDRSASRFGFSTVEEGVRYRIRPLLIQPIIQYLRGKNILH